MQIILLERVPKLGMMGEVVNVRDGFARNYLVPRGKALRATKNSLEDFAKRRKELEARNLERKQDAEKMAAEINGRSVVILRQASETASLYGSVSARDITEAFTASGVNFDRHQVQLDQPLKSLGVHDVAVALHPEVEVTLKVNIARSPEEADIQAGKAAPVTDDGEDATEEQEAV